MPLDELDRQRAEQLVIDEDVRDPTTVAPGPVMSGTTAPPSVVTRHSLIRQARRDERRCS